ncbi:uracil-DNA glycosylase-like protein [Pyronema omphalodes]|nr:uracil-DNA glycosylase-like protein [Pyronema omphalodes]
MPKRKEPTSDPSSTAAALEASGEFEISTPTFNGALSKFAFSSPSSPTSPSSLGSTPSRPSRTKSALAAIKPTSVRRFPRNHTANLSPSEHPMKLEAKEEDSTSTTDSPVKKKRKRPASKYAPPSTYSHLSGIPDVLAPNLLCLFVGTNPGLLTASTGHAYASPSNLFWKLLHQGGLTPDCRRPPTDDLKLPELYSLGNTNLVPRPTRDQAELSVQEMENCVPMLEEKVRKWKPEAVAIVGKGIWERCFKVKMGKKLGKDFKFGWQTERMGVEDGWKGARVFVAVSTSGLVAGYKWDEKLRIMKELGDWVNQRRQERGETAPRGLPEDVVNEAAERREREHREALGEMEVNKEEMLSEEIEEISVKDEQEHEEGLVIRGELADGSDSLMETIKYEPEGN